MFNLSIHKCMKKKLLNHFSPPREKIKLLLVMKLTLTMIFFTVFQASASAFSQAVKVDIDVRNGTLENVIGQIREQSDYMFVYEAADIKNMGTVTVTMNGADIGDVLATCLRGSGITYELKDNMVVLKKATRSVQQPAPPARASVKGVVKDPQGNFIAGVTVVVKGTTRGVATDARGAFTLSVAPNETVVFSFLGKKTLEVEYTGQSDIQVVLEDDHIQIDDVVVTGLFSRPVESYTGAARTITRGQIAQASSSSLLQALSILDPSIQMPENINAGSNPNVLAEITVRGGNSLIDPQSADAAFNYKSNPNTPLFILDGFEVSLSRINDLDINRVLSVVTLKDATATSIYGSRAANGVIVIETVPAEHGSFRVSYTGQASFEFPDLKGYDLLNAREKYELDLISTSTSGVYGSANYRKFFAQRNNFRLEQIERGVDFDWLRLPLRNAVGHKHNVYIEGGDESITYGISASYDMRNGVMRESGRENMSLASSLQFRYKDILFKNELSIGYNKAENSPFGSFSQYATMNPYWAPVDEEGNIPFYVENVTSRDVPTMFSRIANPYYNSTLNIKDESKYRIITENLFAQWNATPWLKFTGRLAYTEQSDESDVFYPAQHTSFANIPQSESYRKGSYTKGYGNRTSIESTFTADFSKTFDRHVVYASVGATVQEVKYNTESYTVEGFPNDNVGDLLMGNRYPVNSKPTGSESISRLAGYFANATYTYDTRFLLDASFRYDGSSLFGSKKRFAPFFSLGAGWNLHNESFLKNSRLVDRLKVRYSYGYTGSQNFDAYLGITTSKYYTDQDYRYHYGTYLMGYGNEALQWQRTLKHNIGIDLHLKQRLSLTFNYFYETTEGSIATVSLAPSTGFASYKENMGDISNKGWELYAQYTILNRLETRENWSVFFNAFKVKGEIKKVSNMLEAMNKVNSETLSYLPLPRYEEGMSTTAIWAVKSLGIDPGTGLEIYRKLDGTTTNVYNTIDQQVVGDSRSALEGTFGTNFEYRGWGANLFFRYRFGGQAYNQTLVDKVEMADLNYNVDRRVLEERWQEPGDKTFFKGVRYYQMSSFSDGVWNEGVYYSMDGYPTYATSRFVQDDNLLALESVSLYYRFNDRFNRRLGISNSKLSLYMSDVFWLSTIKRERGLEYPFSRSFTLQLQFTF